VVGVTLFRVCFQTCSGDWYWSETDLDFEWSEEDGKENDASASLVEGMGSMGLNKEEEVMVEGEGVVELEGEEGREGGRRKWKREEYVERQREMRKERNGRIKERRREMLRRVVEGDMTQEEMVRETVGRSVRAEERKREREVKRTEKNRRKRERWSANRKARREATEVKMAVGGTAVTVGRDVGVMAVPEPNGFVPDQQVGDMLRRLEELEAGVQRRVDEGVASGVRAIVEKSDRVWEERVKWERVQHEAEVKEVKREVGDLREKLDKTGRGREHDRTNYGRTKYVTNKMDGRYHNRYNNNNGNNNNNNSNNNSNNNNYYKNNRVPRGYHQPSVQGRSARSNTKVVTGPVVNVASSARRTSSGPVGVALSRSPDPSRTDFRVRERGVARVTETLVGDK
jgi:hypothetical protein